MHQKVGRIRTCKTKIVFSSICILMHFSDLYFYTYADCIFMASEEGEFTYKSDGSPNVCGLYFISPPESLVEIEFTSVNVDCQTGLAVVRFFQRILMMNELYFIMVKDP